MNLNFLCFFLVLIFTVSFLASQEEEKRETFIVKSIGEVTLKIESRVEIKDKPTIEIPEGFQFLAGEYIIDTYKLLLPNGRTIWSKTESNFKAFGKMDVVRIYSIEHLNEKLFVAYSSSGKVWVDELSLDDKKNWKINKTAEIMRYIEFRPITKCVISVHETDKKQIKFLFEVVVQGEEAFLYKDGVVEKVEKERKE